MRYGVPIAEADIAEEMARIGATNYKGKNAVGFVSMEEFARLLLCNYETSGSFLLDKVIGADRNNLVLITRARRWISDFKETMRFKPSGKIIKCKSTKNFRVCLIRDFQLRSFCVKHKVKMIDAIRMIEGRSEKLSHNFWVMSYL